MALTELQMPTKENFYANVRHAASEMNNLMKRWEDMAEFLGKMGVADLDAIGVAAGQVRTDLVDFRIVVEEQLELYNGSAVTPTKNASAVIDNLRTMT